MSYGVYRHNTVLGAEQVLGWMGGAVDVRTTGISEVKWGNREISWACCIADMADDDHQEKCS